MQGTTQAPQSPARSGKAGMGEGNSAAGKLVHALNNFVGVACGPTGTSRRRRWWAALLAPARRDHLCSSGLGGSCVGRFSDRITRSWRREGPASGACSHGSSPSMRLTMSASMGLNANAPIEGDWSAPERAKRGQVHTWRQRAGQHGKASGDNALAWHSGPIPQVRLQPSREECFPVCCAHFVTSLRQLPHAHVNTAATDAACGLTVLSVCCWASSPPVFF